jgi:2-aminoadipate transaminase
VADVAQRGEEREGVADRREGSAVVTTTVLAVAGTASTEVWCNFDQGLPDPRHFPVADLERCVVETLRADGADALKYYGDGGPSEMQLGSVALREEIAARAGRRDGRAVGVDEVILAHGSTDGLALAVRALLGPGDGAVVEAATYAHTERFVRATGATIRTVPLDDDGMVVNDLRGVLGALRDDGVRPRLIYTIPTFQSPTGTVLTYARREELLAVAGEWDVLVLEDNCYYELAYEGPPPPTLFALDASGRVVQSDSFSKVIAPGLRLAWVIAGAEVVAELAAARQDFSVSQLLARAVARYVAEGSLDAHIVELRDVYRRKRDITATALLEHCGGCVRFRVPAGGLYFWLELAPGVRWEAARARARKLGVACRPADSLAGDPSGRGFVRLAPMQVPDADIDRGIEVLGRAIAASTG